MEIYRAIVCKNCRAFFAMECFSQNETSLHDCAYFFFDDYNVANIVPVDTILRCGNCNRGVGGVMNHPNDAETDNKVYRFSSLHVSRMKVCTWRNILMFELYTFWKYEVTAIFPFIQLSQHKETQRNEISSTTEH